jgi:hypothetical protein
MTRRGDWMQTFTGRQFWPLDPRAEEIHIEDIAHSLAMQCRYAGHSIRFYSVAEHCVHIAREANRLSGPEVAMWALLHDASEAYLVDVPRPLKRFLTGYAELEDAVMAAVCVRFGLDFAMPPIVKQLDGDILRDESFQNMTTPPVAWEYPTNQSLGLNLGYWSPEVAEAEFIQMFDALEIARRA